VISQICYEQIENFTEIIVNFHNKIFFTGPSVGLRPNHTPGTRALVIITGNRSASLTSQLLLRNTYFSGILLHFFLNLRIDTADSDTESVKLSVDEELKDSRPAINDFDCGVFLFLEAF
jgi:hypothetical protein